ncbi:hypothetical protein KOI35_19035 [Actinoplanes bogorensis]|uniref:Uncharacterized protein n=1 Tax=Paractinoplanes bogorensis TaxID=1610840 RepID=A0ABS5YQ78_9ACTN|nr:hypothetical protein [Actinoplanes bogorensis]MBU2665609.1 hypothetical protein [Actinoplanes bogorensis]
MRHPWYSWVNPWTCARNLFKPASANPYAPFQRLSDWRARIGLVAVVLLSVKNLDFPFLLSDRIFGAQVSFVGGGIVVGLGVAAFWYRHPDRITGLVRVAVRQVLRRVAIMAVVAGGLLLSAVVVPESAQDATPDSSAVLWPIVIATAWLTVFGWSMMWYAIRWTYGVSEIDPMLGPAVTAVSAVVGAIVGQIVDLGDNRDPVVSTTITVVALVSVFAIAGAEAYLVRRGPRSEPPPHPYEPGRYVYPPGRRTGLDAFSRWIAGPPSGLTITALVVLWLLPPVGFVLALISLARVGRSYHQGAGLALTALVASVVWPIVYATAIR